MSLADRYYLPFAAAFVRGRIAQGAAVELDAALCSKPWEVLSESELETIFEAGKAAGLRLHKFKRTQGLPRVERVLGILRSLAPTELLDVGAGRGVFLWPLLDGFPQLPITAIDQSEQRAADLEAVRLGGVGRLSPLLMDATEMAFENDSFDVVTFLEVLEHIPTPTAALAHAVRVARRFVVVSVPSQPDDNPEHLHLFDERQLREMFRSAGAQNVRFEYVLNHLLAVARVFEK
jgi:2-polyprenyl-3-methyl-5-hydroxy-6-metoxy-1,4-benzoquinol methylase